MCVDCVHFRGTTLTPQNVRLQAAMTTVEAVAGQTLWLPKGFRCGQPQEVSADIPTAQA